MSPEIFLLRIIFVVHILMTCTAAENATSNSTDKYKFKKVDSIKKMYGGKELKPPPTILTVTDEVWFDLKISNYYGKGSHFRQRITVACFGKITPATCDYFISLIKGFKKGELLLSYRGTKVQKIIRDFIIRLGDVKSRFSSRVKIDDRKFHDESFALSHNHAGWVGMANFRSESSGSQFYITLRPARWMDGRLVIFGKVIKGMDAVQTIGLEETDGDNKPLRSIVVENCGVVRIKSPYTLTAEQFNTDGDIVTGR